MMADHFSFVYDKAGNAKDIECHFHRTIYRPDIDTDQLDDKPIHDYFSSNVTMPRTGDVPSIIKKEALQSYKPIVLDWMRYPWTHGRASSSSSGGAKKVKYDARPIINDAFNDLWQERQFKSMIAFGLRKPGEARVLWTVSFNRKGRRPTNRLQQAYTFETPDESEHHVQAKLAELIPRFE